MKSKKTDISNLTYEVFQRLGLTHPTVQQVELMYALLNHLDTRKEAQFDTRLSPRERTCLQLLSEGNSLDNIAVLMNIKRTTVATFIKRIKKKLNCETLAQAVHKGIEK